MTHAASRHVDRQAADAVLHCLLAALNWLPQCPSAATNCEGSHSVRLLNGQQPEFFSAQNENYATSTANKSKFKYKLITFVF